MDQKEIEAAPIGIGVPLGDKDPRGVAFGTPSVSFTEAPES
jgi:hypothetical protein